MRMSTTKPKTRNLSKFELILDYTFRKYPPTTDKFIQHVPSFVNEIHEIVKRYVFYKSKGRIVGFSANSHIKRGTGAIEIISPDLALSILRSVYGKLDPASEAFLLKSFLSWQVFHENGHSHGPPYVTDKSYMYFLLGFTGLGTKRFLLRRRLIEKDDFFVPPLTPGEINMITNMVSDMYIDMYAQQVMRNLTVKVDARKLIANYEHLHSMMPEQAEGHRMMEVVSLPELMLAHVYGADTEHKTKLVEFGYRLVDIARNSLRRDGWRSFTAFLKDPLAAVQGEDIASMIADFEEMLLDYVFDGNLEGTSEFLTRFARLSPLGQATVLMGGFIGVYGILKLIIKEKIEEHMQKMPFSMDAELEIGNEKLDENEKDELKDMHAKAKRTLQKLQKKLKQKMGNQQGRAQKKTGSSSSKSGQEETPEKTNTNKQGQQEQQEQAGGSKTGKACKQAAPRSGSKQSSASQSSASQSGSKTDETGESSEQEQGGDGSSGRRHEQKRSGRSGGSREETGSRRDDQQEGGGSSTGKTGSGEEEEEKEGGSGKENEKKERGSGKEEEKESGGGEDGSRETEKRKDGKTGRGKDKEESGDGNERRAGGESGNKDEEKDEAGSGGSGKRKDEDRDGTGSGRSDKSENVEREDGDESTGKEKDGSREKGQDKESDRTGEKREEQEENRNRQDRTGRPGPEYGDGTESYTRIEDDSEEPEKRETVEIDIRTAKGFLAGKKWTEILVFSRQWLSKDARIFFAKHLLKPELYIPKPKFRYKGHIDVKKYDYVVRQGQVRPESLPLYKKHGDVRFIETRDITYRTILVPADIGLAGLPSRITIVLDESGSTTAVAGFNLKFAGAPIRMTVFDAETIPVISLLYHTRNLARQAGHPDNARVVLFRFSDEVRPVEFDRLRDGYEYIASLGSDKKLPIMGGGTNLDRAVRDAVRTHIDDRFNFFVVVTDAEIDVKMAEDVVQMINSNVRRSPVIFIVINSQVDKRIEEILREIEERDKRRRRVIVVRDAEDYKSIEKAVEDIIRNTLFR